MKIDQNMRERVKHMKAAQAVRTITSGKVTLEIYNKRMAECQKCECKREKDGKIYCGCCGCPKWWLSELEKKLWFKKLICPLNRPGFYNGRD